MRIQSARDLSSLARDRRVTRGWSQAEVARRAGVSRKWVSDFERGKENVDLASVLRLIDVLGVVLNWVYPEARTGRGRAVTGPHSDDDFDLDEFLEGYHRR